MDSAEQHELDKIRLRNLVQYLEFHGRRMAGDNPQGSKDAREDAAALRRVLDRMRDDATRAEMCMRELRTQCASYASQLDAIDAASTHPEGSSE